VRQYLLAHGLDKRDAFEPLNADVAVEDIVELTRSLHGFLFRTASAWDLEWLDGSDQKALLIRSTADRTRLRTVPSSDISSASGPPAAADAAIISAAIGIAMIHPSDPPSPDVRISIRLLRESPIRRAISQVPGSPRCCEW
jgi:hypothetical protein